MFVDFFFEYFSAVAITFAIVTLSQLFLIAAVFGRKSTNVAFKIFSRRHSWLDLVTRLLLTMFIFGGACNIAVWSVNDWKMPVALSPNAVHMLSDDGRHSVLTPQTRLTFLADIFVIKGKKMIFYSSIGDLLLIPGALGYFSVLSFLFPFVFVLLGFLLCRKKQRQRRT